VIHFALNTRASIALNFTRSVAGRSVGGRCVARSTHNSHRRRCRLTVSVRVLAGTGHAGANRYSFYGRVGPTRKLATGSYALAITATNAAGTSRATGPSFTIVRG
jgi:hypothetical protein